MWTQDVGNLFEGVRRVGGIGLGRRRCVARMCMFGLRMWMDGWSLGRLKALCRAVICLEKVCLLVNAFGWF